MKPLLRLLFFIILAVLAVAVTGSLPGSAQGEKQTFIRYYLDSPQDLAFLRSHPELDIVSVGNKSSYVDIIAGDDGVAALGNSGARLEILENKLDVRFLSDTGRTVAQVVAFMDTLRMLYPHVVSQKWSLGQSHEGRDIWCFRMSDDPDVDQNRPATLFDALHHPGEWPSMELDIRLAEYFAQNYGSDPEVTYLLDRREVYFVPIVNPDGRAYIEDTGNSWPKKNRRDNGDGTFGINLNRNYPFMWGVSDEPNADSTWCACYHGPYAGSEPETQAIMGLVNSRDFVTHQSYHTPGKVTFYPWAYSLAPTPDAAIYTHMGEMMTLMNSYEHGPVGEFLNSVFSGPTIDWSYGAQGEHEKIFAFTNEVASSGAGTVEEAFQQILADNIWAALYLIRVAGAFVEAGDPAVIGGNANGSLDPGETAGLSFTLTNEGVRKEATGLSVRISCDDPYLQLADAERAVGTIAAFSSADFSAAPFTATVDPACPPGRTINVNVTVIQQDGPLQYVVPYVVGGPVVIFSEDFESGTDGWTLTGTWDLTTWESNSPPFSLTDSPDDDYNNDDSTSATITQPITASNLSLSFWHTYRTESTFDYTMVQVSFDGGPWTTLPGAMYTGASGAWQHVELSLADYVGKPVQIRFRLESDEVTTDDGWYIDDVVLTGAEQSNQTPPPPMLVSPAPGASVNTDPVLTVANSSDPDGGGTLTYGFRVYSDSLCTVLAAYVDSVAEGSGLTAWTPPPVSDGNYWWRAYAADSLERGLLGETRRFQKSIVAILVQRFEARKVGTAIRLAWDIIADESVAGFNLYRKKGQEEDEELVNEYGLIPAGDRSYDDETFEAGHIYYYVLSAVRPDGSEVRSRAVNVKTIPYELSLHQNYPNPFNPTTAISFTLPEKIHVNLSIFDVEGKQVTTLVDKVLDEGFQDVIWEGMDARGNAVSSGVYFYRLKAGKRVLTRKLVVVR